jgi:hypothetical protein
MIARVISVLNNIGFAMASISALVIALTPYFRNNYCIAVSGFTYLFDLSRPYQGLSLALVQFCVGKVRNANTVQDYLDWVKKQSL